MTPEQTQTRLERLRLRSVDGLGASLVLKVGHLNPEQQLALVMKQLLVHQQSTLLLVEVVNMQAAECVTWRKTPEGLAWAEKKSVERAQKYIADAVSGSAAPTRLE